MDETGHSDDPALHFAGMAGFVAPLEKWMAFEKEWQPTLDDYKLKEPFHMKDCAHSFGQFVDWKDKKEKRKELFGKLIAIIRKTEAKPIGAIVSLEAYGGLHVEQQKHFHSPYMLVFQLCTRGMALEGLGTPANEKVEMVYSYNQEYGTTQTTPYSADQAGNAERLWHEIKKQTDFGSWMGSYASRTPADTVQLQAADIIAYELSKDFENRIRRPNDRMRFGLREILRMSHIPLPMIRFFDRRELLRLIVEASFPCRIGVEELERTQELSAMESMIRWMVTRGDWK
jgi:hypothetical protein